MILYNGKKINLTKKISIIHFALNNDKKINLTKFISLTKIVVILAAATSVSFVYIALLYIFR